MRMTRKLPKQFIGALNQSQIDALGQCSPGDFVFNLDTLLCQVWDGSQWKNVGSGLGGNTVVGAYEGNGQQGGQLINLRGPVQYLKIMRTVRIPTPGYLNWAEKYDVWYNPDKKLQYWIEYHTVEGKGITCAVHESYIDNGIFFNENGFGFTGFDPLFNGGGMKYTYFAVLSDGRDKSKEYHVPQVDK
jgi:hypothetical protein